MDDFDCNKPFNLPSLSPPHSDGSMMIKAVSPFNDDLFQFEEKVIIIFVPNGFYFGIEAFNFPNLLQIFISNALSPLITKRIAQKCESRLVVL